MPGSVDLIICHGSFQNFPAKSGDVEGQFDLETALKVLQRWYSLLKPRGKISIEYLPPQPPVSFHEQTTTMDPARFHSLFKQAGFITTTDRSVYGYFHDQLKVDVNYRLVQGYKL